MDAIPYCGRPPVPGALAERWNFDPVAITALAAVVVLYALAHREPARGWRKRSAFASGWCVVAIGVISPLCALAVALFSARMAQHLLLVLVAAPLLVYGHLDTVLGRSGFGYRAKRASPAAPLAAGLAFAACWWFWHAPGPYDAALHSTSLYASMQVTLLASAFGLWRVLVRRAGFGSLVIGLATAVHMGLLGALLTFAPEPLHVSHLTTTSLWGLSALEDQQLAGLLCWVPGCGVFLLTGLATAASWLAEDSNAISRNRLQEAQ